MSLDFNADEIFRMALQIEKNGVRFYQRAAKEAGQSPSKEMFLRLAAMEENHEKIFAQMRANLTEAERKKLVFEPEDEASAYLRAWADIHVFDVRTDPADKLTGKETAEELLQTAIGLEKDSIVFYLGMKPAVPARLGRQRIDEIIGEEMRHLDSLSRQLESLGHQRL